MASEEEFYRLVKETHQLARENNRLLKKIRRDAFYGKVWRFITLVAAIAVPFVLYYYFLQPRIERVLNTYENLQGNVEQIEGNFRELESLSEMPTVPQWVKNVFGTGTTTE